VTSQKIAVIGSGISGLSAAWLLSQRHDVCLFEAAKTLGGHANTVRIAVPEGEIAVDAGFIVYNNKTYPNLSALFDYLSVPTANATMGFAVSLGGGAYEYAGAGLGSLVGHASNLCKPGHLRLMRDLVRFFNTASAAARASVSGQSLGHFLTEHGYSQEFIHCHLLPMAGAIWSSSPQGMLDYPVHCFMRFCDNHGLLNFFDRPQWRTVENGSVEYVQRLVADSRMRVIENFAVKRVERQTQGVVIHGIDGLPHHFDQVVIATHADQALAVLAEPSAAEQHILGAFDYSQNRAVMHHDESFMPRRKRLWSAWNYVSNRAAAGSRSVTYWMNALQPLATQKNIFVTLNPEREPLEMVREFDYAHPIFNAQTFQMQKRLWSLQGQNRTWYCGAHFGAGFHEDGLQSGLAVAEQLGGVTRPWQVDNKNGRIHVGVPPADAQPKFVEAAE
jgi:uncharacterized protein